jgi:hypothetical protein
VTAPVTVCGNAVGNATATCTVPTTTSGNPPGTVTVPVTVPVLVCGNAAGLLGTATANCGGSTPTPPVTPVPPVEPPVNPMPPVGPPTAPDGPGGLGVAGANIHPIADLRPVASASGLAFTGTDARDMAALALLLLMLGSLALLVGARRREA